MWDLNIIDFSMYSSVSVESSISMPSSRFRSSNGLTHICLVHFLFYLSFLVLSFLHVYRSISAVLLNAAAATGACNRNLYTTKSDAIDVRTAANSC